MYANVVVYLLIIGAALFAGFSAWGLRRAPGLQALPLASLGVALWALGQALDALNPAPAQRLLWLRLMLLGNDLLLIAWLAFVLLYTQGRQRLSGPVWIGLLLLPLFSQLTAAPTPALTSIQPAVWLERDAVIPWLAVRHSLWGWAHLLAGAAILLLGGFLLILHLARTPGILRRRTRRVNLGALVPMLVFVLETAGVRSQSGLAITPLAFLAGGYAFLWGLQRGAHFQILPLARDLLLERMELGVVVLNADGVIIDANPAAAALCGRMVAQLLGLRLAEMFPPLKSVLEAAPAQNTLRTEFQLQLGEQPRCLDIRLTPLYTDRRFSGYMVELHDITRRRLAEEALRESEQRYRSVIDGMIEGVVIQDAQGAIIACNPNAEHILGLRREQILGRTSMDPNWRAIYEDGSPYPGEAHPSMLALRTGQRQSHVTMGLYMPDGSLRWLLINSQPLIRPGEALPYAVVSTFVDITEDRLIQQSLKDSENKFRGLLEFAPVAIIISDDQGRIQLLNARAEQLFGYGRDELLGKSIEKLLPERYRQTHVFQRQDFIQRSRSRPMGQGLELVAMRSDGSEFPVDVGLNLIHTNQGKLVMSYLMDISDRKQAEEALRQANEKLIRSLAELEGRNRELMTLNEMGDMLQICTTVQEAYAAIAAFAIRLFPDSAGALYIVRPEGSWFDAAIAWGEPLEVEIPLSTEMCWALRRGQLHSAALSSQTLDCQHVAHLSGHGYTNYTCVPMQAQGEVIGLFHLRWKAPQPPPLADQLAATVAEHITLSLSNLRLREDLRSQSIRDPLTGVFNRRYMEEAFTHELYRAARHSRPVGVIMLDVDHFKAINDAHGHAYGDNLLKALAAYLKNRLRGEDILCRYGGEEFTIILPDTTLENTLALAERLRSEIQALELEPGSPPLEPIRISLGVAAFPEHGRNAEELLKSADWALYQAKKRGRDQVITADLPT